MSDYSRTKPNPEGQYPVGFPVFDNDQGSGFTRVEPYLTPDDLKDDQLFGIPLYSPITKQELSDASIKKAIQRAYAKVELECNIDIFPVQHIKKIDFDRTKYIQGYNQLNLGQKNIRSIEEVSIRTVDSASDPYRPANPSDPNRYGTILYNFPLEWVDMSHASKGLLHFVPLQTAFSGTGIAGAAYSASSAAIYQVFSKLQFIPGFWCIMYTTGFENNAVPAPVNELAAVTASIELLSRLAPGTNRNSSTSIGLDGASQAISNAGVQIYATRIADLEVRRQELLDLVKAKFTASIWMDNI
jgi:hypothetical protein